VAETVALRRAERVLGDVDTALEVCRLFHRGLQDVRRDLELRIRLVSVEGYLER
jgi:hypothetical protein